MASGAQIELWHAEKVATQATVQDAPNGIRFAAFGETRISDADLERLVGAVPATLAPALRPEDAREDMRKALRFLGYAVPDGDMTARAMLDYAATRT